MGHVPLLNADVARGALVTPFDVVLRRRHAYCVVHPDRRALPRRTRLFRDWILTEATPRAASGAA